MVGSNRLAKSEPIDVSGALMVPRLSLSSLFRRSECDHPNTMPPSHPELTAMQKAFDALEGLDADQRKRVVHWLTGSLDIQGLPAEPDTETASEDGDAGVSAGSPSREKPSSGSLAQTPKAFLAEKKPTTAVERMACLAFFSAHGRGTPTFKAADLNALNVEAAAAKFTNPGRDFDNADRASGYLVDAGEGKKQLSMRGEAVVNALPDRDAVKKALAEHPHKRRSGSRKSPRATTKSRSER
jgi:hypothetical protein